MDFRAAFTENWPYKVAAIVLSVLLWLSVATDRERTDQQVSTRLEIQIADSTWSLRSAQDEVMTTFQGRGGDIFALFDQPTIRKVIEEVEDSVMRVSLAASDVRYDRSLNVRPTAVTPSEVVVRLEPRRTRTVPVRVDSDAEAEAGYVIDAIQVDPESVLVAGPGSIVASITEVPTERLELGPIRRRVDRQAALRLPDGLGEVSVSPATVLVSVGVDSVRARSFRVSVAAAGPYAEEATLEPSTVQVEVRGGASAVSALEATDIRATVDVASPVTAARSQAVRVELPADVTANVVLTPRRVSVRPRPETAPPEGSP